MGFSDKNGRCAGHLLVRSGPTFPPAGKGIPARFSEHPGDRPGYSGVRDGCLPEHGLFHPGSRSSGVYV